MSRQALRARLLDARTAFAKGPEFKSAERSICAHLGELLAALEPDLLGVYWAVRSEFNLSLLITGIRAAGQPLLALPFAHSASVSGADAMHFRTWTEALPDARDDCGIASSAGRPVVPDVVLVPCVGFARSGYRMGYGGGYFDRWLALNPHVTAVGVAWSGSEIDEAEFGAQSHDIAMSLIVTEKGAV